jgi:hypothetical protein
MCTASTGAGTVPDYEIEAYAPKEHHVGLEPTTFCSEGKHCTNSANDALYFKAFIRGRRQAEPLPHIFSCVTQSLVFR